MGWIGDVRSQLANLDDSRRALVRFGITLGVALLVIGGLVFLFGAHRERAYAAGAAGVLFLLLAAAAPKALRPVQTGWMAFAFALGWIMSRVILTVFFFVAVTPVGLLMRLLGKNPLAAREADGSYWVRRKGPERTAKDYERLF